MAHPATRGDTCCFTSQAKHAQSVWKPLGSKTHLEQSLAHPGEVNNLCDGIWGKTAKGIKVDFSINCLLKAVPKSDGLVFTLKFFLWLSTLEAQLTPILTPSCSNQGLSSHTLLKETLLHWPLPLGSALDCSPHSPPCTDLCPTGLRWTAVHTHLPALTSAPRACPGLQCTLTSVHWPLPLGPAPGCSAHSPLCTDLCPSGLPRAAVHTHLPALTSAPRACPGLQCTLFAYSCSCMQAWFACTLSGDLLSACSAPESKPRVLKLLQ